MIQVKIKKSGHTGHIIGWCPDRHGKPQALVLLKNHVVSLKLNQFCVEKDKN